MYRSGYKQVMKVRQTRYVIHKCRQTDRTIANSEV